MERIVATNIPDAIKAMGRLLAGKPTPIYFDIESTGLNPRKHKLVSLAFHNREQSYTVVIDARHIDRTLKPILSRVFDGSRLVIGHNLKFDAGFVREKVGLRMARVFDTMLAEQLIAGLGTSEAQQIQFELNLRAVAERRGITVSKEERNWFIDLDTRLETRERIRWEPALKGHPMRGALAYQEDSNGFAWEQARVIETFKPWDEPFPEEQVDYIYQDVEVLPVIFDDQLTKLKAHGLVTPGQIEFRSLPAFVEIEGNGMPFDADGWREIITEKSEEADRIESEVMAVFTPLIAQALEAEHAPKMSEWLEWKERKEHFESFARHTYDQGGANGGVLMIHSGEKWGEYKKRVIAAWKAENPNPKKPGEPVKPNLGSPKQVLAALTALGVPVKSTSTPALEPFKEEYPEVKLMIDWRKAAKFVVAFGEGLLAKGEPMEWTYEDEDGVEHTLIGIHSDIQQIGASTGRTSMRNPNLQQIPARGPDGKRMRSKIKAPKGWKILTADFPNIELRILAELANDENMLRLFNEGADLHAATARFMFDLPEDFDVTQLVPGLKASYRDIAKAINFGLMYGMSAKRLAGILKCPIERAQELLDKYFNFYPQIRAWLDKTATQVYDDMKSRTRTGRWRKFSLPSVPVRTEGEDWQTWKERHDEWKRLKARVQRQGVNHQVQGYNADITKEALALIVENLGTAPWKLIGVVHDEVVMMVPEVQAEQGKAFLARQMWRACVTHLKKVSIPEIEVSVADYWKK